MSYSFTFDRKQVQRQAKDALGRKLSSRELERADHVLDDVVAKAMEYLDDELTEVFGRDYELSDNQQQFVRDAKAAGLDIDWHYSGRGMYGGECPAVRVDNVHSLQTQANVCTDQMGLGYVIYARS